MKVHIGPYINWWGPYQIAEFICFWSPKRSSAVCADAEDDQPTSAEKFGEFLASIDWLCDLCEWIHSKRSRKIKVRIHQYDTWNMDNTLAHIVVPMLKQLQTTKHGAPCTDDEDVPEELRSTSAPPKANEWDTDANHFKRWDYILDEMIFAFEYERDDQGCEVGNDELHARVRNGFRLFGKYYTHLWD